MEFDLEQVEKRHIERILASEHGAVEQAARRLDRRFIRSQAEIDDYLREERKSWE